MSDFTDYRGLAFPVRRGGNGYFTSRSGIDLAWSSILYAVLCPRGSRIMRRDFGSTIRESVFAPADALTAAQIRSSVSDAVLRHVPTVILAGVEVTQDGRNYKVAVSFSLKRDPSSADTRTFSISSNGGAIQ